MRKMKKTLAALAIVGMVLTTLPAQLFAADATTRLADADRVGTSIAIANNGWTTADTVIVAPADDANLVDALAVAPLAGQANAPILMTYKDALDSRVQAEITALKAKNVYAVGALSPAAVAQLSAISGVTVTSLQGTDRFDTAAKIAAKLTSPKGTFVVGYNGVADAMSAASFAAANGYAILIADLDGKLPANEALVGTTTYTLGGPTLVADIAGATRLYGANRYDTNDAVLAKLTYKYDKVYVANGESLVDALAGSALAAKTGSAIVLTDGVNATAAATVEKGMTSTSVTIAFGGAGVVPETVRAGVTYQAPAVLSVTSVSAINLKEINVQFNKAVDKTTAETIENYTLSAGSVSTAVLDAATNTVTLTLAAALGQQTSVDVTVANVKDAAGIAIASTTKTVVLTDTTLPQPLSVAVTGPTTIQVTYSEPIQTAGTYTLNGGTYYVGSSSISGRVVTLNIAALANGTYTLNTVNDVDFAGFKSLAKDLSFTYTTDTTAPTVSISKVQQNQVTLAFNKDIVTGASNIKVYHTYSGNSNYAATSYSWTDSKTLVANFAGNYLPVGNATIYVVAGDETNVLDAWSNALKNATLTAQVTADTVAPTVTSVVGVDSTHFDVTFSETVTGADLAANYTLKDSAAAPLTVSSSVLKAGTTSTYTLTTSLMNGGSYTLSIPAGVIKDTSIAQNANAAYTTTIAVADKVAPTVDTAVTNAADSTATKIRVSFSEPMATSGAGSVLDSGVYQYNTAALPTGTTIVADGSKAVVITLPAAETISGKTIVVGRVADLAGNFTTTFSTPLTINADVVDGSDIVNAKTVNTNTVTFEVLSPLTAIDVSKFTVNSKTAASASYVNQKVNDGATDGALVTLTVGTADKWTSDVTPVIATTTAGALTTSFGTKVGASVTLATAADKTSPAFVSAKVTTPSAITVTYSENIKPSSVSVYSYTVSNNTITAATVTNNTVVLTLGTALTGTDATAQVTQVASIQDVAGNTLAPSAIVTVTDGQPATLTGDFTNSDTKVVTVNFSEAMDATTLVQANFSSVAGGVITAFSVASNNKSVTITFTTGLVSGNSVVVTTSVKDVAGNAIATATLTK